MSDGRTGTEPVPRSDGERSLWEFSVLYPNGVRVNGFDTALAAAEFAKAAKDAVVQRRTAWESVSVTIGCERHMDEPHNLCEACWAVEP